MTELANVQNHLFLIHPSGKFSSLVDQNVVVAHIAGTTCHDELAKEYLLCMTYILIRQFFFQKPKASFCIKSSSQKWCPIRWLFKKPYTTLTEKRCWWLITIVSCGFWSAWIWMKELRLSLIPFLVNWATSVKSMCEIMSKLFCNHYQYCIRLSKPPRSKW